MLNNIRWLVPETGASPACENKEIVVSSASGSPATWTGSL